MLPLSTKPIPQSILRTYISYARQYVKPKLTIEAAAVLQEYYLELRSKIKQFGNIPIFNRQLEALIRLTEVECLSFCAKKKIYIYIKYIILYIYIILFLLQARAKLELRVEATESDALDVIDILRYAITNTLEDDVTPRLNSDGKLTNKKVS